MQERRLDVGQGDGTVARHGPEPYRAGENVERGRRATAKVDLCIFVEGPQLRSSASLRSSYHDWGSSVVRTKSLRIAAVGFAGLALAMAWAPQRARAEIVYEIVYEFDMSDQLGTISFPSVSGDSVAGVDLSYGSFTAADITSVSWTLNPSTFAVLGLDLSAAIGSCSPASAPCSSSSLHLSPDVASPGSLSCGVDTCLGFAEIIPVDYVLAAIPEPSTWVMMLLGFAGLGFAGYRQRQKRSGAASI
jgi:hypothetical protein